MAEKKIKIVLTQTLVYRISENDPGYYEEEDAVNIHMAALVDLKSLDDGVFEWSDLVYIADEDDSEYKATIVEQEEGVTVKEYDVKENYTDRDEALFPKDDEDADDDEDEEPEPFTPSPLQ